MSESTAKMAPKWCAAYVTKKGRPGLAFCADCGELIADTDKETNREVPIGAECLNKKKHWCQRCESPLWTWTRSIDRWPVAQYVRRQMPGFFDYLICDEAHEEKNDHSARAVALGTLTGAVRKTLLLTGTLIGGKAEDVRSLLFRTAPSSLVAEGLGWADAHEFNERYGRIETVITEKSGKAGADNKQSRGSSKTTRSAVRPGVMPTLFGRHLLQRAIFLGLDELAENLPAYQEDVIEVPMDAEQRTAYVDLEEALRSAVKEAIKAGDRRLLSAMLHTLLGYCDHPYGWGEIGYYAPDEESATGQTWIHVATPPDLDAATVRPKEQALLDYVKRERAAGRQCWVFCEMTQKRDVQPRLAAMFEAAGMKVEILRSGDVSTTKREEWIRKHGAGADVIISHPQLVQTGLDLFDLGGRYNFVTLIFYQTGYQLFTLRQASRRSWRIGQRELCKVAYMFYGATMQASAMDLMAQKLECSLAIEGKFSDQGLAALTEETEGTEMALAKSLLSNAERAAVGRRWRKISGFHTNAVEPPKPLPPPLPPDFPPADSVFRRISMF